MFKKKRIKIQVSSWPSFVMILCFVLLPILLIAINIPIFGFFGIYTLLEKIDYVQFSFFEHWYQSYFYLAFFLLVIFIMVLMLDFLNLLVLATFNIKLSTSAIIIGYLIQYGISVFCFNKIILSLFEHIQFTWQGSIILFIVIYLITITFSDDGKEPPEDLVKENN